MTEQIGDQKAAVGTASRNRVSKNGGSVADAPPGSTSASAASVEAMEAASKGSAAAASERTAAVEPVEAASKVSKGAASERTASVEAGPKVSKGAVSERTSVSSSSVNAASASPASSAYPAGPVGGTGTGVPGLQARHAVLRYTTLRLVLFLVALLLVWGVAVVLNMDLSSQLSKLTLIAVALLLSSAASFVLLSKYRDEMSAGIVARTQRLSKKFDDAASFEDEDE